MPIEYLMFMPLAICLGLLAIVLAASALVSLARAACLTGRARFGWSLVILLLPVAGPLAWLGYNQHRDRRALAKDALTGPADVPTEAARTIQPGVPAQAERANRPAVP